MATGAQAMDAAKQFNFQGDVTAAEPYGEGHINDTFLITTKEGTVTGRYILQRINTHVFKEPEKLMGNVVAVTQYLESAAGGEAQTETLRVIPTNSGRQFYATAEGEFWRAYNFIKSGISFQTATSPRLLEASGEGFGRFARLLDGFLVARLHETIPKFHDTRQRLANLKQALKTDSHNRAAACKAEIDFVLAREKDCGVLMDLLDAGELPLRVTHNDTKLNNVLIHPDTLRPVCVIDLDTVMPGLIANDFGDAIRTGATAAAEDEQDLSKVTFSLPLYRAYAESYLREVGGILSQKEKEMLPWGARLMTLECGMRFLTDHLQGDVYFKIHRDGHNLDRARAQFKLVRDMEDAWANMALV